MAAASPSPSIFDRVVPRDAFEMEVLALRTLLHSSLDAAMDGVPNGSEAAEVAIATKLVALQLELSKEMQLAEQCRVALEGHLRGSR